MYSQTSGVVGEIRVEGDLWLSVVDPRGGSSDSLLTLKMSYTNIMLIFLQIFIVNIH